MKKTLAYCMAILLTAVSLAGCAGDTSELDAEIEGLEQEELRLRGELETAQAEISDLESQYQKLLSDFTEQEESAAEITLKSAAAAEAKPASGKVNRL